jgi:Concanavalin A-like lectin/glucanases superfamily/PEP-CTERM motif
MPQRNTLEILVMMSFGRFGRILGKAIMINHWSLRRTGLLCASALCAALAFGGSAGAATLVADYEFNGNLSSSIAGAPDLVATDPLGTASFSGGVYNWTGAATPTSDQGGLSFDSTGLLNPSEYTVALTFKFNERDNAWRRIIDVDNRMSDDGFYVDPSNNLDVFPLAGSTSAFTTGVFHTVTLTVDGTIVTAFLDGVEQFKNLSTDIMDISSTGIINLFLDNTVAGGQGEWSSGSIDSALFYNGIAPPVATPEPSTWAMLLIGFAGLGFAGWRGSQKAVTQTA